MATKATNTIDTEVPASDTTKHVQHKLIDVPVEKPTPHSDLVITVNDAGDVLTIYVANVKNAAWVESEAPQFGSLSEFESGRLGVYKNYQLRVSPFYDTVAVKVWLMSVPE